MNELKAIPEFIPKETWEAYLLMRKKKKKEATDYAQKLLIKKLIVWKAEGRDILEILENSIINSWTDLYLVKHDKDIKQTSMPSGSVEKTKELIKKYEEPIARAGAGYKEFRKQFKNIVRH